ncbi:hypothetical protein, partial [Escherichia coli]|uniref:hypothetical protein n=1 Tax=Escherichia coli TaxID=562 RepID=UPI0015F74088
TVSDPRYSIGIDLGTTHCALSYVDSSASDGEKITQQVLPIAQLTDDAYIAKRAAEVNPKEPSDTKSVQPGLGTTMPEKA